MWLTKNPAFDQVLPVGALGLGLSSSLNEGSTALKTSNHRLEVLSVGALGFEPRASSYPLNGDAPHAANKKNLAFDQVLPVGALGLGLSSPLNEGSTALKNSNHRLEFLPVGALGFEPRASCTPCKRASRAALRPELDKRYYTANLPLGKGEILFYPN